MNNKKRALETITEIATKYELLEVDIVHALRNASGPVEAIPKTSVGEWLQSIGLVILAIGGYASLMYYQAQLSLGGIALLTLMPGCLLFLISLMAKNARKELLALAGLPLAATLIGIGSALGIHVITGLGQFTAIALGSLVVCVIFGMIAVQQKSTSVLALSFLALVAAGISLMLNLPFNAYVGYVVFAMVIFIFSHLCMSTQYQAISALGLLLASILMSIGLVGLTQHSGLVYLLYGVIVLMLGYAAAYQSRIIFAYALMSMVALSTYIVYQKVGISGWPVLLVCAGFCFFLLSVFVSFLPKGLFDD